MEIDIVSVIVLAVLLSLIAFVVLLALPDVIGSIADSIVETRDSVDRLKEALRGKNDA